MIRSYHTVLNPGEVQQAKVQAKAHLKNNPSPTGKKNRPVKHRRAFRASHTRWLRPTVVELWFLVARQAALKAFVRVRPLVTASCVELANRRSNHQLAVVEAHYRTRSIEQRGIRTASPEPVSVKILSITTGRRLERASHDTAAGNRVLVIQTKQDGWGPCLVNPIGISYSGWR
ncbi:hypothetical protein BaRGS_00008792 [Batillaria attramentaria]|uniref:Uncharacterized protein n=1 Tax=Batillaria attramentaria TaxID=370345 RepID=A0ABD0LLQ5_9CAEN